MGTPTFTKRKYATPTSTDTGLERRSVEPLGNVAGIASEVLPEGENELQYFDKFELQNLAARLLPGERVCQCLRYRAPVNYEKNSPIWYNVEVHKSEATGTAHYENLIICNRVWGCPVCGSRISEFRRVALTTALERTDYQTVLLTLTLSHHLGDDLKFILDALMAAYRNLKSGRFWQGLKAKYDWVGDVRSLEVTYGDENGWHPHIHALMVFENELSDKELETLENDLKKRWLEVLERNGVSADWEHGCDIKAGDQHIRDYVAKYGRLPKIEKKPKWTLEHEVAKSHVKRGRVKGRTPFELLADYGNGDAQAGALFVEYYNCFKGRHQLQWSRGLRELLGMDEIEAEMKEEAQTDADQMIVELNPVEWNKVVYNRVRGKILEIAVEGSVADIWVFIADLPEPPPKPERRRT